MNEILPPGMDGRTYNGRQASDGSLQNWQRNASEILARSTERTKSDSYTAQRVQSTMYTLRPYTHHRGLYMEEEKPKTTGKGLSIKTHRSPIRLKKEEVEVVPLDYLSVFHLSVFPADLGIALSTSPPTNGDFPAVYLRAGIVSAPCIQRSLPRSTMYYLSLIFLTRLGFLRPLQDLLHRYRGPTQRKPNIGDVPSVDSLPFPVATEDANKILMLMKTLCGRMRGEVEYQIVENGPRYAGICYIDDIKGSLMYEGDDRGPFHLVVISDLRGCRVKPFNSPERPIKCLELSNRASGIAIHLKPMVKAEYDLWLAALLCWQQIRTTPLSASPPRSSAPPLVEKRPSNQRRDSVLSQRGATIIKVAQLLLWDKGAPSSPTAIVRRVSTRDLRSLKRSGWRKVSCILQDNGEFKLLTENDITLLSVIQLSQLSRCAIQRLDRSVLDEEFCIAIFPQYTPTSTQLSIFRPVYIALESRLTHEVWFCLLRAFTVPEIYGPRSSISENCDGQGVNQPLPSTNDMFRLEKSISLRIVEARIRTVSKINISHSEKSMKASEHDPSVGDYLVEVILGGEVRARTKTRTKTRNPFWREDCEFLDLPAHLPSLSIVLKQVVHPMTSAHGFLSSSVVQAPNASVEMTCGITEIPLEKLGEGTDNESWWPILDDQQQQIGELFLRVRHDELIVLLAKDYQPISELLHNFSSGLTVQIAQAIPTRLKTLAEILMNIFQVSGHAGEWLTALVEDEVDGLGKEAPSSRLRWSRRLGSNESYSSMMDREQTVRDVGKSLQGEANLLFRGNSLLTQALDFYMRRVGKEYLEEVLSEKINGINTMNPECEVDPSRISHADELDKNWTLLTVLTTDIWESIAGSAQRCPPELRQILKYIRAVTEDRYGDFLRTTAYTSVSGFLFLRFFCPALLNPKLFGILPDHPQPKAQRSLTLIAKSLQALANLSHFGQKEIWMEPMNRFLTAHRQGIKDFLDSICDIPAERNGGYALPASYSTPITILARLPPTSREGFPSLPYLIDHARNFSSLVKLWLDTTTHYMAPLGLEGELLDFHKLCLGLQRRTDDCLLKAEGADRGADNLSLQWEDIVETLKISTDVTSPSTYSNPDREPYSEPELESPLGTSYNAMNTINPEPNQRLPSGSACSEVEISEQKERRSLWDYTLVKEVVKESKYQKPYDTVTDTSQASPPSRGQSRNGKTSGFLSGFRRKGKGSDANTHYIESAGAGSSWNGPGGMF
ncbi:hypothetical protein LZ554_007406 [Drepanopeziza brunnea f. sp. 'monogermtubi']|nr:hypothetical protein LZ554_007406 [Drepanopeziza brunnea f. sp. 'monogermtubi']